MFKSNKISFLNLIIGTFDLLPQMFRQIKIFVVYSAIISFVYALFGQWSYSCNIEDKGWWCYSTDTTKTYFIYLWGVYIAILLYLFLSFIYDLYRCAFNKDKFTIQSVFTINKQKIYGIGAVLSYILAFFLPLTLGMYILLRPANPDWRIEAVYFIILFVCALFPVLILRMCSIISYYLQDNRIPSIEKIFNQTSGQNIVIVIIFCFLVLILNIVNLQISSIFNQLATQNNNFTIAVITEFAGNFTKLVYASIILAFSRGQLELLEKFEGKSPETDGINAEKTND